MKELLKKHYLPVEVFKEIKESLKHIKSDTSSMFKELGDFIILTANEINSFRKLFEPYVNYFYPKEMVSDNETFINDLIVPSRDKMNFAVDMIIDNLNDEKLISDKVANSISETFALQETIDSILATIEEIELYFLNTLLISVKAGSEGLALTKISEEMGKLSEKGNTISEKTKGLIEKLNILNHNFNDNRMGIEAIQEEYLKEMKDSARLVIYEMLDEVSLMSDEINDFLNTSDVIEKSIKGIINNLHMEDLLRQNFEKMIFLIGEMVEGRDKLYEAVKESINENDFDRIIMYLAKRKLTDIENSINELYSEINDCISMIKKNSRNILARFDHSTVNNNEDDNVSENIDDVSAAKPGRLSSVFNKMENLKNKFTSHIDEIKSREKNIFEISQEILSIINKFHAFFKGISAISRKFKIINMLTRIEFARGSKIREKLGSAIPEISRLPSVIKGKVDDAVILYNNVSSSIESSIYSYSGKYRELESVWNLCINSMDSISVKLNESRNYYTEISTQIRNNSEKLINYIDREEVRQNELIKTNDIIKGIVNKLEGYSSEMNPGDDSLNNCFLSELKALRDYYEKTREKGEYKNLMIISLLSEFIDKGDNESVTFF